MTITVQELANLAMDTDQQDIIDWDFLKLNRDQAYMLIASSIHEEFVKDSPTQDDYYALLACLVNLTVENFSLNLRMHTGNF